MSLYRILFLGDVVGKPGRKILRDHLRKFISELNPSLTIVNGENSAGGLGIDPATTEEIFSAGAQVITTGNHVWNRREFHSVLERESHRVIRPINYAEGAPGKGWCIWEDQAGVRVGVVNAMGRIFMTDLLDCPFRSLDRVLQSELADVDLVFLDFHGEATSEKVAMGLYVDGRVAAVVGTHTHVQTADERILPKGTAYISDAGMCGPRDGVIGMEGGAVVEKFVSGRPVRFEVAKGVSMINGVIIDCDPKERRAVKIERLQFVAPE